MAIACLAAATLMENFGRKSVMRAVSMTFFVCWMILYFSVNFYGLLLGRFVTGFCAGVTTPTASVYIGEITQASYRGLTMPMIIFCATLGMLIPHALGLYLNWKIIAVICAMIPLLAAMLTTMIPESPPWLVRNDRTEEAAEIFTWLRGQNDDSVDEFNKMVESHKLSANLPNSSLGYRNLPTMARTKSFYKPFLILLLFVTTLQTSGSNVLIYYTVVILKDSIGDYINEYIASMILDTTRLVGSVGACFILKNVGRRQLTAFSGFAMTATLFSLAIYLHFASTNERLKSVYGIPLALYMLYMIFIASGFYPLIVTLSQELFPLRYRAFGSSFVILFNYVCAFATVKIAPALYLILGEKGVYLSFGSCCIIGTTILMVFLPETRNKTLKEIEDIYNNSSSPPNPQTTKTNDKQQT